MALKYALHPFPLKNGSKKEYQLRVTDQRSYTMEELIEDMHKAGSTFTKSEIMGFMEAQWQMIIRRLAEGRSFKSPFIKFDHSLSGTLAETGDRFDPDVNEIRIHARPGKRILEIIPDIELQKVDPKQRRPELHNYQDYTSDTINTAITLRGAARIIGENLKFDETDDEQGIFFINEIGWEATKVDAIIRNKPSELLFQNPDLASGNYRIEVRSMLEFTSEIRKGELYSPLRVDD